jgi:GNAT superfamily N-acetyltransferase
VNYFQHLKENWKIALHSLNDFSEHFLHGLIPIIKWKHFHSETCDLKEDEDFIHNKFGYCYYSLKEHLIYNLYIRSQYRRCGHSKKLLKYVINEIRKTGYIGEIKIQAKPEEDSISSDKLIEYYKSMGLEIM